MKYFSLLALLLFYFVLPAQDIDLPVQPSTGPGGSDYSHTIVRVFDFAAQADGYWLYEAAGPKPVEAPVVVFIHGYGAYNPMIYGQWIEHLVRKGNTVIFPRYQKNLTSPKPDDFSTNASKAIRDALEILQTGDHVRPSDAPLALVGHSYGGVISADLAVNFKKHSIPQPKAVFLCSPGTGPLKGGRLDDYKELLPDVNLLIMTSQNDRTVGDEFAFLVYETAINTKNRNLIQQYSDLHTKPGISAGHNESYCLNENYDSGVYNISAKRALRKGKLDPVDYFGYWKLFDALLDCTRNGGHCEYAMGNTPQQRFMGFWSDGTPIRELKINIPDANSSETDPRTVNATTEK